ncbi:hypothetical protein [cyanobacterium endosymbiont of Rhopalodia gibberula]|uniref:hypothetical protein n=1 Tax=cyanobacterium endosymbiont of Rhopalodia gibberula TaxID=1763363 RepID=UPI0015590567|nr:hypothetical protein [cyanobacterium endosymbiont of Rhopalodia gibberula]
MLIALTFLSSHCSSVISYPLGLNQIIPLRLIREVLFLETTYAVEKQGVDDET